VLKLQLTDDPNHTKETQTTCPCKPEAVRIMPRQKPRPDKAGSMELLQRHFMNPAARAECRSTIQIQTRISPGKNRSRIGANVASSWRLY